MVLKTVSKKWKLLALYGITCMYIVTLCGAPDRVKLLINQETGEAVAMKIVDLAKHPDAIDAVRKEMCLHRMLKNPHVIKFYGRDKFWYF